MAADEEWALEYVKERVDAEGIVFRLRYSEGRTKARIDVYQNYNFCTSFHDDILGAGWMHAGQHIYVPRFVIGNIFIRYDTASEIIDAAKAVMGKAKRAWPGKPWHRQCPIDLLPFYMKPWFEEPNQRDVCIVDLSRAPVLAALLMEPRS